MVSFDHMYLHPVIDPLFQAGEVKRTLAPFPPHRLLPRHSRLRAPGRDCFNSMECGSMPGGASHYEYKLIIFPSNLLIEYDIFMRDVAHCLNLQGLRITSKGKE